MELFNERRLELIDELFAEDYVDHLERPPGVPEGLEGLRMFVTARAVAFPDLRYEVIGQYQDGDIHIGHVRVSATMTGDFLGMPASGKSATWEEIHIGRMVGAGCRSTGPSSTSWACSSSWGSCPRRPAAERRGVPRIPRPTR